MTATILVILFISLWILFNWTNQRYHKQPPGPWALPVLGHLPFLGTNPAKTFLRWKKTYGAIIFVKFGSWDMVVLNDAKIIREAFAKKALSGRAVIPAFQVHNGKGLISGDSAGTFEVRKFALIHLKENFLNSPRYEEFLQDIITSEVNKFRRNPGQPQTVLHFFTVPAVHLLWKIIFGDKIPMEKDRLMCLTDAIQKCTAIPNVLVMMTIFFNWARYIIPEWLVNNPIKEAVGIANHIMGSAISLCQKSRIPGQPRGFVDAYLDESAKVSSNPNSAFHDEEFLRFNCTELFIAGVETSSTAVDWIIFYLVTNPGIQKLLQEEIDRVIGRSATPSLADKSQMPYYEAILQEAFRCAAFVPLGLFHRALEDTTVRGFTIKKHQMICANIYGIQLDDDIWEDPDQFKPERFLNEEGQLVRTKVDVIPFSTGRRLCIGETVARNQIFMAVTCLFQQYDIQLAGSIGKEQPFGFALRPPDFQVFVTPRN